jgi:hypothetical protein
MSADQVIAAMGDVRRVKGLGWVRPAIVTMVGVGWLLLIAAPARAETLTNTFAGVLSLQGDISEFFDANGDPLPGVCVANSTAPPIPGQAVDANGNSTAGLGGSPVGVLGSKTGQYHPSGFNPRRLIAALNTNLYGGTIYIGIDLPGGTGSKANPDYMDPLTCGGHPPCPDSISPPIQRGSIRPFDADGNGDPQSIGTNVLEHTALTACSRATTDSVVDIFTCNSPFGAEGAIDDPSDAISAPGAVEQYQVTITYTNGQSVTASFIEDNTTSSGHARLEVSPAGFGVMASMDGTGVPLGYDVEFALTNVNANVDPVTRQQFTVAAVSGSNDDGPAQGEPSEVLYGRYEPDPPFEINSISVQSNNVLLTWLALGGTTNVVEATAGGSAGSYSNNFSPISSLLVVPYVGFTNMSYLDVGGATNFPSRYYRVAAVP